MKQVFLRASCMCKIERLRAISARVCIHVVPIIEQRPNMFLFTSLVSKLGTILWIVHTQC